MQTKQIKELKTQASALGRHLLAAHGLKLPHSALLEALAAMHNAPDWNALQARDTSGEKKAPKLLEAAATPDAGAQAPGMAKMLSPQELMEAAKSTFSAQQLLQAAMANGLTSGETLNAFAYAQTPYEQAYAQHARTRMVDEGVLEFDDPGCLVSLSHKGAYVLGWSWVDSASLRLAPKSLDAALVYEYKLVSVLREDEEDSDDDLLCYSVSAELTKGDAGNEVLRIVSTEDAPAFEPFEVPRNLQAEVVKHDFADDEKLDEGALLKAHPQLWDDIMEDWHELPHSAIEVSFNEWKLRFVRMPAEV